MRIYGWELHAVWHHPEKFCDHRYCDNVISRDHMFATLLYINLWVKTPHVESPPCHVWWQWSSTSGDMKYLICHVTSQSEVNKGSCNFMSESSSWYVTILPCLVVIGSGDIMFLVSIRVDYFYGLPLLKVCHHLAKFGGHKHCGSGDIILLVYQVILRDHVINGPCDYIGRIPSK